MAAIAFNNGNVDQTTSSITTINSNSYLWNDLPTTASPSYACPIRHSYYRKHVVSSAVLNSQGLDTVKTLLSDQTTAWAIHDLKKQIIISNPDFPQFEDITPHTSITEQRFQIDVDPETGLHEIAIQVNASTNVIAYWSESGPVSIVGHAWNEDCNFKNVLKQNLLIKIKKKQERQPLVNPETQAEMKARGSLRDMISEAEWRRYVTNGFIMVKGNSGLWYQIFNRRNEKMRVYKDNKWIESICIHSDDSCPPTDHVINVKVSLEIDEDSVRAGGNINKPYLVDQTQKPQPKLIEAFENYKKTKLRLIA